jgi:aspartyl-tRNA(Asn)/glutamyl-tRNA(Gln) amidotransferase subunit A
MNVLSSFPSRSQTIAAIAQQIRQQRRTCADVLDECFRRIDELEPQVRAWVIVDRGGAAEQSRRLDTELAAGRYRGTLHGIPIGIKDIVDIAGFATTAGSPLLEGNVASCDATIVERLRQAGAVIVGKTVTTQFASFDPPPTRNPWNLACTPGGSSSGSAAAVACGMCLGAIGSQTGGSITRPAAFCGVAGCKPTWARISTAGVMPLAPSMDHPGPIARSVHDLAILLDAIAGPDARDPLCSGQAFMPVAMAVEEPLERPPRLGVLRGLFWDMADEYARDSLTRSLEAFRASGARVHEVALPASFTDVLRSHRVLMSVEAAAGHEQRFRQHSRDYLPKIYSLVDEGLRAAAPDYVRAKQHQDQLRREIIQCFKDADALVTPATLGPAPDVSTTGDPAFNSPWSFTGLPTVSYPTAITSDGLPLAVQLIGRAFHERELFRCAAWCESAAGYGA